MYAVRHLKSETHEWTIGRKLRWWWPKLKQATHQPPASLNSQKWIPARLNRNSESTWRSPTIIHQFLTQEWQLSRHHPARRSSRAARSWRHYKIARRQREMPTPREGKALEAIIRRVSTASAIGRSEISRPRTRRRAGTRRLPAHPCHPNTRSRATAASCLAVSKQLHQGIRASAFQPKTKI